MVWEGFIIKCRWEEDEGMNMQMDYFPGREESRCKGPLVGHLLQLWNAQRWPVWLQQRAKCEFKVWLGGGGGQSRRTVLALARV